METVVKHGNAHSGANRTVVTEKGMELNVLIVDDEKFLRRIVMNLMGRIEWPFRFIEAEDGEPAIQLLRKGDIDLVVLDLFMPEVSGLAVLEYIRKHPETKDVPVVIVSAATAEDVRAAYTLGISHYIVKPFEPKDFVRHLSNVVHDTLAKKGRVRDSFNHLLIIDTDKDYRAYFREMLADRYTIYEAETAQVGAAIYYQHREIEAVFIAPEVNGGWELLHKRVRDMRNIPPPEIYLLRKGGARKSPPPELQGQMPKTRQTIEFLDAFVDGFLRQKQHHGIRVLEIIKQRLAMEYKECVIRALHKLLGEQQPFIYQARIEVIPDVQAVVQIRDESRDFSLAVSIVGSSSNFLRIAQIIRPGNTSEDQTWSKDVMELLIDKVAGETCHYLKRQSMAVIHEESLVGGILSNPLSYEWAARFPFVNDSGEVRFVAIIGLLGNKIRSEYV